MKKGLFLIGVLLLASCSGKPAQMLPSSQSSVIDWVDFVNWDDTTYTANYETNEMDKVWKTERVLGEVTYTLDGHAGANHTSKNGDAAYLPKGTKLYEIKGYDPAFRILANDKIYEVSEAGKAEKVEDFLDIEGKVNRVILQSEEDLSFIGEFSEVHTKEFIDELLLLPYEEAGRTTEGKRVFFGIELTDGSMTRSLYWPETGYINYGTTASERLKEIFEAGMKASNH